MTRRVVRGERAEVLAALEHWLTEHPDVPVDITRDALYTPRELYDTDAYDESVDARAYAWSRQPRSRQDATARALHDHAIDLALEQWLNGRQVVGVMGAHAALRGSPNYVATARLGHALGGSFTVATGGGPGTMEAANLGAWLGHRPAEDLDEALRMLGPVPAFFPSVSAWVRQAFEVLERFPGGTESLGIPTWYYGHEPPNVFATAIAKYFRNALREATLLEACTAGILFLPGHGGTLQEIFQDACENYYADESAVAPMVLVGASYWTEELPAWPLLQRLAKGRAMEKHVHLVDSVKDAVNLVVSGT